MARHSLHQLIKSTTGQDVYKCRQCQLCDLDVIDDMDVPLTTVIQMIMFDDEEVLSTRTLWSERVLAESTHACRRGLNLQKVLQALRTEARQRGIEAE